MFKFFSDAFKEIGHVVWPTPKETRTYMNYTIIVIVVMTIFLALAGYVFRTSLQTAKNVVNPGSVATSEQIHAAQQAQHEAAMQDVYDQFGLASSGTTVEVTGSGATENAEVEVQAAETTNTENTENTENIVLPSEAEEAQAE